MDRLAAQEYSPEVIIAISESLARVQRNSPVTSLDFDAAQKIVQQSRTGAVGVLKLIWLAMQEVRDNV